MLHILRQDYVRNFLGGFALAAMAMIAAQPGLL